MLGDGSGYVAALGFLVALGLVSSDIRDLKHQKEQYENYLRQIFTITVEHHPEQCETRFNYYSHNGPYLFSFTLDRRTEQVSRDFEGDNSVCSQDRVLLDESTGKSLVGKLKELAKEEKLYEHCQG